MGYEKYGIKKLRAELSSVLSSVERNGQRVIIGKNNDSIAALVSMNDLAVLDKLDEQRAHDAPNLPDAALQSEEAAELHATVDALFADFEEHETDESRYTDEEGAQSVIINLNEEPVYDYQPSAEADSPNYIMQQMPADAQAYAKKLYKLLDEAMASGTNMVRLFNGVAALLAQDHQVSNLQVRGRMMRFGEVRDADQLLVAAKVLNTLAGSSEEPMVKVGKRYFGAQGRVRELGAGELVPTTDITWTVKPDRDQ